MMLRWSLCAWAVLSASKASAQPEPEPAPPPATGAVTGQLGTQGIGVELALDFIPYVQFGLGGSATFEKERGRVFARGRFPIEQRLQLLAGLAYNRGKFQEQNECGFLDHSCSNDVLLEGPIRSVQLDAGFNFTPGKVRLALLAGIERLISEPICHPGARVCLVEKTSFHATLGVGFAF